MKVVVIGGGGQVGGKIASYCKQKGIEAYSTYLSRQPSLDLERAYPLDKTDSKAVRTFFHNVKPDAVIDTAALHNVDYCETHREEAFRVNEGGTLNVASACRHVGAKMVFISTDYVFDGRKGMYTEEDAPSPQSQYAMSKFRGEQAVAENSDDYIIARPSVIYSWVPPQPVAASTSGKPLNFAAWVAQKLSKDEPVKAVDDQYSSPTLADSLAEALVEAVEKDLTGLYHIAGKSRLSRFDFTSKLAEHMGFKKDLITPVRTSDLQQLAKRPKDSSLNVSKAEHDIGMRLLHIETALDTFARQARGEVIRA